MSRTPAFADVPLLEIRPASPGDAAAVRSVALAARIDAWTSAQYAEETEREGAVFLLATGADRVEGFISGRLIPGTSSESDAEIYNIAVLPEKKGRGIGRMLLAQAVAWFRSACCGSIWLEVRAGNAAAINFYEKNGFVPITVRKKFYSNPVEDGIVMRLTLEVGSVPGPDRSA